MRSDALVLEDWWWFFTRWTVSAFRAIAEVSLYYQGYWMQHQIHFPISQDHGALCPNMPWTSQRNFLSLHNFPKQNLRVKMYHSDPRRLGFNNHWLDWLEFNNFDTEGHIHVCMLPTNHKRKGMFKHKAVSEITFNSFTPPICSAPRTWMQNQNALFHTTEPVTNGWRNTTTRKASSQFSLFWLYWFFQITRQTPSPKFACDKLYIRLRSEGQWAEDRRGVRTKKRYEVDQATSYYYCSHFVDRTGNEILY